MKLFYNDHALHDWGDILISSQQTVGLPEDAPQRWQHTLRVKLHFRQPNYSDNKSLVEEVRSALKSGQEAMLKWEDGNGTVWLDQTVKVLNVDWPENPNEKGTYLQALHIAFLYFENFDAERTQCLRATFQRTGTATPVITLGTVESFKREYDARRYHPMRPHRELVAGRLTVRGWFLGNPLTPVAERRVALLTEVDRLNTEIHRGMHGRFRFASTDQLVKVENFLADINQAQNAISWSLSMTFTEFPNEAGYAQCEFSVRTREEKAEGKVFLTLSGAIGANSETAARAKLDAVRTSVLAAAGGQFATLRSETNTEQLAVEDGETFLKLTFDEEFQRLTAGLTAWQLRVSDTDDPRSGLIRRVYAGFVIAKSNASFDAAYQTAAQKARALGDQKHQFKLSGQITVEDPQLSAERVTTGEWTVRVEFSFEYQLKGSRVFMEITSQFNRETFGTDSEQVSGFIVASDPATARNLYSAFKVGYAGLVFHSEQITERREKIAKDGAPSGGVKSPPKAGSWGVTVNSGEVKDNSPEPASPWITNPTRLDDDYARQWLRLEFSFSLHRPKAAGQAAVTMRYEFSVAKDFLTREKVTTLRGSVWASDGPFPLSQIPDGASLYLDTFLSSLNLGQRAQSERTASRERVTLGGQPKDVFLVLNFTETYHDSLSGPAAILRCEINEEIECSGLRIVVQPTAADNDVFQRCGKQSGRRILSGSVTATDETTALAYIKRQRRMPLAFGSLTAGAKEELPPQISFEAESLPLQELYLRPGKYGETQDRSANFKMVRVRFRFTELYEELTLPI